MDPAKEKMRLSLHVAGASKKRAADGEPGAEQAVQGGSNNPDEKGRKRQRARRDNYALSEIIGATVVEKQDGALLVQLDPHPNTSVSKPTLGLLPKEHLSDHPGHWDALFERYSVGSRVERAMVLSYKSRDTDEALINAADPDGDASSQGETKHRDQDNDKGHQSKTTATTKTKKKSKGKPEMKGREQSKSSGRAAAGDVSESPVLLTLKTALKVEASHKSLPSKLEQVVPDTPVAGYVSSVQDVGVFVRFLGGLQGLVHKSNVADGWVGDPREHVVVGQTVIAQAVVADLVKSRLYLTMKPSIVNTPSSVFVRTLLSELRSIFLRSSVDGAVARQQREHLRLLQLGQVVEARVVQLKQEVGIVLELVGRAGVTAFCLKDHCPMESPGVGSVVKCRVLDVDFEKAIVDVTLRSAHVRAGSATGRSRSISIDEGVSPLPVGVAASASSSGSAPSTLGLTPQSSLSTSSTENMAAPARGRTRSASLTLLGGGHVGRARSGSITDSLQAPTAVASNEREKGATSTAPAGAGPAAIGVVVELVKPQYAVLSIPARHHVLALACTASYNGRRPGLDALRVGIKCLARACPDAHESACDARLPLEVLEVIPEHGIEDRRPRARSGSVSESSGPRMHAALGSVVDCRVNDIGKKWMSVSLLRTKVAGVKGHRVRARVHLTDVADPGEVTGFAEFSVGDVVKGKIVEIVSAQANGDAGRRHRADSTAAEEQASGGDKEKAHSVVVVSLRPFEVAMPEPQVSPVLQWESAALKPGLVCTGIVDGHRDDGVWVSLSRSLRGFVHCTKLASRVEELERIFNDEGGVERSLPVGTPVQVQVESIDRSARRLDLRRMS